MQGEALVKEFIIQASFADGGVEDRAEGQQDDPFSQCNIQGIEPKGAANVDRQFPAYQKGIEETGHN